MCNKLEFKIWKLVNKAFADLDNIGIRTEMVNRVIDKYIFERNWIRANKINIKKYHKLFVKWLNALCGKHNPIKITKAKENLYNYSEIIVPRKIANKIK